MSQPPPDLIAVARILGAFGVRGDIKVLPYAGKDSALAVVNSCYLRIFSELTDNPKEQYSLYKMVNLRWHDDAILFSTDPLLSREDIQNKARQEVFLSRADLPKLTQGEFYEVDLIGYTVVDSKQKLLGELVGFLETPAHSVMRVVLLEKRAKSGEELIPFIGHVVSQVRVSDKTIVVDWDIDY